MALYQEKICPECDGRRRVPCYECRGGTVVSIYICSRCHGDNFCNCYTCEGKGYIKPGLGIKSILTGEDVDF